MFTVEEIQAQAALMLSKDTGGNTESDLKYRAIHERLVRIDTHVALMTLSLPEHDQLAQDMAAE